MITQYFIPSIPFPVVSGGLTGGVNWWAEGGVEFEGESEGVEIEGA